MQQFAHSWASPGTTGVMSKISLQLPAHSTFSPGKKQSSIGAQSARTPSTASRPSSPPAPSLPSRTPACRSGCRLYRRLYRRPRCNPRTSTGRQGAHYLLCLVLPQPGRESLPCHETGVPHHRLGRRQIPPLPDVNVIRGLHRPLRAAVAQDDAHRIRPP